MQETEVQKLLVELPERGVAAFHYNWKRKSPKHIAEMDYSMVLLQMNYAKSATILNKEELNLIVGAIKDLQNLPIPLNSEFKDTEQKEEMPEFLRVMMGGMPGVATADKRRPASVDCPNCGGGMAFGAGGWCPSCIEENIEEENGSTR